MFRVLALFSVLIISTELSAACLTSSPKLKSTVTTTCTGDISNDSAVYSFSPAKNASLFISGEAMTGCGDFPSYLWQELSADGRVLNSVDAYDSMEAEAGKIYQLKVLVKEPSCSQYSITTYVSQY